jgi:hypothetical protein
LYIITGDRPDVPIIPKPVTFLKLALSGLIIVFSLVLFKLLVE